MQKKKHILKLIKNKCIKCGKCWVFLRIIIWDLSLALDILKRHMLVEFRKSALEKYIVIAVVSDRYWGEGLF